MKFSRAELIAVLLLVGSFVACEKATGVPEDNSASVPAPQTLPFDREGRSVGISPTRSLVPAVSKLPEGTSITIRLQNAVSSATSIAGDTFHGTVDEPVVIAGQTAVARGSAVIGRVLAAKASGGVQDPGYLRIALVSVDVSGSPAGIETSSLFAKGGSHDKRAGALTGGLAAGGKGASEGGAAATTGKKEASFEAGRRLTFRLAQAVDLAK